MLKWGIVFDKQSFFLGSFVTWLYAQRRHLAIETRPILPGLVFHSDRGSQYASKDFIKLLAREKCI